MRLRLSSIRQPYRRGGIVIGTRADPTILVQGDIAPAAALAIFLDPAVALAVNEGDGEDWKVPTIEERQLAVAGLQGAIGADEVRVDPASPPTNDAALAAAEVEVADLKTKVATADDAARTSREAMLAALRERDTAVEDLAKAKQALAIAETDVAELRGELALAMTAPEKSDPPAAKPKAGKSPAPAKD